MIEIVRHTRRNVKRRQDGDMRKRRTAAGMLVAERQFRRSSATATSPRSSSRSNATQREPLHPAPPPPFTPSCRKPLPCDRQIPEAALKVPRRSGHPRADFQEGLGFSSATLDAGDRAAQSILVVHSGNSLVFPGACSRLSLAVRKPWSYYSANSMGRTAEMLEEHPFTIPAYLKSGLDVLVYVHCQTEMPTNTFPVEFEYYPAPLEIGLPS
jgi:hypothetical protein